MHVKHQASSPSTSCHVYCVPFGNFQNPFPSHLSDLLTPHNSDLQTFSFCFKLPIFFLNEGSELGILTYFIFLILEVFMLKTLVQPLVTCCVFKKNLCLTLIHYLNLEYTKPNYYMESPGESLMEKQGSKLVPYD